MGVNLDKPYRWKNDIAASVDLYNEWFLSFAPTTYRMERKKAIENVAIMLRRTEFLRNISSEVLRSDPSILSSLRMSTAPPIARDRLVGLCGVSRNLVNNMELRHRLPPRMNDLKLREELSKIASMVTQLLDVDIFPWLTEGRSPTSEEIYRSATIVADRLCGANADPIIRNAQEKRQLQKIKTWLESRQYEDRTGKVSLKSIRPGEFAFRLNVPGLREDGNAVNIPIDVVVMPRQEGQANLPLFIEAKSAGDFTNTNKRRKEEAMKVSQLRRKFGDSVQFVLFLCGYFDSGYLGYEAAEGIDWVWEHRIDDLEKFGL